MATESRSTQRRMRGFLLQTRTEFFRSINTDVTAWGIDAFAVYSVISNRAAMRILICKINFSPVEMTLPCLCSLCVSVDFFPKNSEREKKVYDKV